MSLASVQLELIGSAMGDQVITQEGGVSEEHVLVTQSVDYEEAVWSKNK